MSLDMIISIVMLLIAIVGSMISATGILFSLIPGHLFVLGVNIILFIWNFCLGVLWIEKIKKDKNSVINGFA